MRYGQTRPLEQGMPLDVRAGETVERIDFTLPRAGVITGRVVDELGDPVADVPVFAMRTGYWQGRRRFVPSGNPARTDDTGEYRVGGLMPGTYLMMAVLRETWTVRESGVEQTLGYAPTYSPGTAVVAEAQRVTLRAGQQLGAIDVALVAARAASIFRQRHRCSGTSADWAVCRARTRDDRTQGTWNDASFIESLRPHGEPLTLTEGEARTVALKLVTP